MKSKLLFFVLILLTFLLLPFGVKSRPKEQTMLKVKSFEELKPNPVRDELKGNYLDSDVLNRELV
ncbi:MAG: hypothetical protein WBD28_02565 [Candidatus Zixiibacteriota bacterium]